jgi:hypothetical protein
VSHLQVSLLSKRLAGTHQKTCQACRSETSTPPPPQHTHTQTTTTTPPPPLCGSGAEWRFLGYARIVPAWQVTCSLVSGRWGKPLTRCAVCLRLIGARRYILKDLPDMCFCGNEHPSIPPPLWR